MNEEQLDKKLDTLLVFIAGKIKEQAARITELEAVVAILQTHTTSKQTSSNKEEVISDDTKSYPSVEDAPVWNVFYKINTSEGIYKTKVKQQAWSEKQAVFLGRTEILFKHMSDKVKAKEIEAKWSILESVAEKIV